MKSGTRHQKKMGQHNRYNIMTAILETDYLNHIQSHFPDLDIQDIQINQEGMVNVSVIINRERVFRFPRTKQGMTIQAHERKALDLIHQYVDSSVPKWDYYTDEMVSYPFIPGEPLLTDDVLRMSDQEQDTLAAKLATFLQQMHSIPLERIKAAGIKGSETARTIDDRLQFYAAVQEHLFPLMWADGREWVHRHFAPFLADHSMWDYEPCFINGDLGTYHLLFDRATNSLNGIIDFGTAGLGDPACDFSIIINQYGESFLRRMQRIYPDISKHIERARFQAGTVELEWVLRGIQSDDQSMFVVHIGRARDILPIGSGWT